MSALHLAAALAGLAFAYAGDWLIRGRPSAADWTMGFESSRSSGAADTRTVGAVFLWGGTTIALLNLFLLLGLLKPASA